MDKSLAVFEKYCRSEATKTNYQYFFGRFVEWCKANVEPMITADGLLTLKEEALQVMIEDYIYSLRHKISPNSYSGTIDGSQEIDKI